MKIVCSNFRLSSSSHKETNTKLSMNCNNVIDAYDVLFEGEIYQSPIFTLEKKKFAIDQVYSVSRRFIILVVTNDLGNQSYECLI